MAESPYGYRTRGLQVECATLCLVFLRIAGRAAAVPIYQCLVAGGPGAPPGGESQGSLHHQFARTKGKTASDTPSDQSIVGTANGSCAAV